MKDLSCLIAFANFSDIACKLGSVKLGWNPNPPFKIDSPLELPSSQ